MYRRRLRCGAVFAIAVMAIAGCERRGNERWATTEDTNLAIDWDQVNQAYRLAEGPVDLQQRLNEIYDGDEVISVAVQDLDAKTQVVTGFFDRDKSGTMDDREKIFTIRRKVTGDGSAEYATRGHGPQYGYYQSPVMTLATGMLMGSMMSRALSPGYVPAYRQPYTTSVGRPKASGSGRFWGGGRAGRSGGARFGIRRASRPGRRPERLTA